MDLPWPLPDNNGELRHAAVAHNQPTFDLSGNCILSSSASKFTSKDLPWPLPVQQYVRTHASVLNVKPTVDPSGRNIYYTYAIRFEVMEVGLDPFQQLASDFALITPSALDTEVALMSVNLYLPWQACVKANVSQCPLVALDADQVSFLSRHADPIWWCLRLSTPSCSLEESLECLEWTWVLSCIRLLFRSPEDRELSRFQFPTISGVPGGTLELPRILRDYLSSLSTAVAKIKISNHVSLLFFIALSSRKS